jgi:hypothetical protein
VSGRSLAAAAATAGLLAAAGCSGGSSAATPEKPVPASSRSHVIVVVMENKEQPEIVGSKDAPYVTALGRRYASAKRMYGVRHPSLPNYLALISGSTHGVTSDCTNCTQGGRTVVDQLESHGVSWRGYMEGMPKACFTGAGHGRYAKKHNPFAYFRSVIDRPKRCAKVVPATQLAGDLENDRMPDFAFVTPDLCNDTHDCSVAHGDRYLSKLIPRLLQGIGPHGFLVLTYDEGETNAGGGGRIPTIVAGPDVRQGATPGTRWNHYSTLRTIEDAFGLDHLRNAAKARPLDSAFTKPPRLR